MNKTPLIAGLSVVLAVVVVAAVYLGTGARPNLGLDLQGGVSAVYTAELPEGQEEPEDFDEVLEEAISVIRARVDSLGIAEPDISRSGSDVLVQLPGDVDEERMQELIGTTAQLTFRKVIAVVPAGAEAREETENLPAIPGYDEGPDCEAPVDEREQLGFDEEGLLCGSPDEVAAGSQVPKYFVGPAALTGDQLDDAFVAFDQSGGGLAVSLEFDNEGAEQFQQITAELACERDQGHPGQGRFAISLDGVVESAPTQGPTVQCGVGLPDGQASITVGGADQSEQEQEAQDLALVLRTGALPITLEPATFETVSASLGTESLQAGLWAGLIGLVLVGAWLIFFYRSLGVVAMAGLGIFGVLMVGLITLLGELGFALTLAGVAGVIVAVGITADSSIIFFERIRDEVNLGKTVRTAVQKAFVSAFRTNLAGNTVTLAAAVILYFLAVGPVRGFALMLGIATLLDLLIMYGFTRPVVFLMGNTKLLTRRSVRAADTAPAATARSRR